jgi:hypothetical protein
MFRIALPMPYLPHFSDEVVESPCGRREHPPAVANYLAAATFRSRAVLSKGFASLGSPEGSVPCNPFPAAKCRQVRHWLPKIVGFCSRLAAGKRFRFRQFSHTESLSHRNNA